MGRPSKYPEEFRREAVELVRTSGRPRAEIARRLGLSDSTLKNWVVKDRQQRQRATDPDALSESESAELKRLRTKGQCHGLRLTSRLKWPFWQIIQSAEQKK